MIYRAKFCDLELTKYYTKTDGVKWRYEIKDKTGELIDVNTGYDTKSHAESVGRKRWTNREDELKAEYVSHLTLVTD